MLIATAELDPHVEFFVPGIPATKGSFRSIISATTGKPITQHDSKKLAGWAAKVSWDAKIAWNRRHSVGPIALGCTFQMVRPDSVTRKARPYPTVKPDLDKMLRAVMDALTGIVYVDDKQVVNISASKKYGGDPGVLISVGVVI